MTSNGPFDLMAIHPETIVRTLEAASNTLNKWKDCFSREEWVEDFNQQTSEYCDLVMAQFMGELKVVAANLAVTVEVLR